MPKTGNLIIKTTLLIFILLLVKVTLRAQENIKIYHIKIINSQNSETLPLATVLINKNPHRGLVTNINGEANISLLQNDSCIQISYVGYETKVISREKITTTIKLKPNKVILNEVTVHPGTNPANRIINKAVKNIKLNNPDNISEYSCNIYNKFLYDATINNKYLDDTALQKVANKMSKFHFFIMESATKRFYKAPDKIFEKIKKVRVVGIKNPSFAPLSTDIQPFHFYKPLIGIFHVNYLNPISQRGHNKYYFTIKDTLYSDNDTTFVISFRPRKNVNFNGLKGFVHINTNRYAIENIVASPAEKKLMGFYIQQKYNFTHNHWFPKELKSELKWKHFSNDTIGMTIKSESYITGFRITIPKDSVKYNEETLVFDKLATKNAKNEMAKYRTIKLSPKDIYSYKKGDSIGEEINADKWLRVFEKLSEKKIPLYKFYIPFDKIYKYNEFEGNRFGLGLYTDDNLIKWLEIGGWGAYGTKDEEWKYGYGFTLFFDKKHETALTGEYSYNAEFPGKADFERNNKFIEGFFLSQADYSTRIKASFKTRLRYFQIKINFLNDLRIPQYSYSFLTNGNWVNRFTISEFGIKIRYAFKEKYIWQLNQKIAIETKWPVLTIGYKKGLKNIYSGEIDYDKVLAQIEYSHNFALLGKTRIKIEGGKIWGKVPYSFLFSGNGTWTRNVPFYVNNSFNTMLPNKFSNNEIVSVYFSHDFRTLLFSTPKWKPKIKITQSIGYGWLKNISVHKDIILSDMSKGYYESGLIINDIYRYNYYNFFYYGIGIGVFYNYGYYASPNEINNIFVKTSFNISF